MEIALLNGIIMTATMRTEKVCHFSPHVQAALSMFDKFIWKKIIRQQHKAEPNVSITKENGERKWGNKEKNKIHTGDKKKKQSRQNVLEGQIFAENVTKQINNNRNKTDLFRFIGAVS